MGNLLCPAEVAERLGCSRSKVYRMLEDGELASIRLGKLIRVPAAEVRRLTNGRVSDRRAGANSAGE